MESTEITELYGIPSQLPPSVFADSFAPQSMIEEDCDGDTEPAKRLTFNYSEEHDHVKVTENSFRARNSMALVFNMNDVVHDSLADLQRLCKKLDIDFYNGAKNPLRVHGIFYKPGDKYVNVACRLKNCPFRINHSYEKDSKGRPTSIKYLQLSSASHRVDAHQDARMKDCNEAIRLEYR